MGTLTHGFKGRVFLVLSTITRQSPSLRRRTKQTRTLMVSLRSICLPPRAQSISPIEEDYYKNDYPDEESSEYDSEGSGVYSVLGPFAYSLRGT